MELEGLKRAVNRLVLAGVNIGTVVTDRHLQISKWIRENMPSGTIHLYDVWHVAKGEYLYFLKLLILLS